MKENKIAGATKVLLDIMNFVGMVVTLTLPVSFKWYGTVMSLFRMCIYSFAIMAVMLCRIPLYFTPAVFIIVVVFLIAGLFSRVLAIVFDKAVQYKEENDFTI